MALDESYVHITPFENSYKQDYIQLKQNKKKNGESKFEAVVLKPYQYGERVSI